MNVSAEKIKKRRQEQGLTQVQISKLLGITQSTYAQYENGKRNPKIETVRRIADALDIPWTDLCDDVDQYTELDATAEYFARMEECRHGVEKGLRAIARKSGNPLDDPFEMDMEKIRDAMEKMNKKGRSEAIKRTEELAELSKYKKA